MIVPALPWIAVWAPITFLYLWWCYSHPCTESRDFGFWARCSPFGDICGMSFVSRIFCIWAPLVPLAVLGGVERSRQAGEILAESRCPSRLCPQRAHRTCADEHHYPLEDIMTRRSIISHRVASSSRAPQQTLVIHEQVGQSGGGIGRGIVLSAVLGAGGSQLRPLVRVASLLASCYSCNAQRIMHRKGALVLNLQIFPESPHVAFEGAC